MVIEVLLLILPRLSTALPTLLATSLILAGEREPHSVAAALTASTPYLIVTLQLTFQLR